MIGMLLSTAGIFSVVSYAMSYRTHEFGIRMALGVEPRDVLKLVLWAAGRILDIGLFAGLALSILASRMLADRMQDLGTADPLLFAVALGILIAATVVACLLLARSATRIQPVEALRHG